MLFVAVVLGVTYLRLTDPARLRGRALETLRLLPFDGIDVGGVTFRPLGRLVLTDVAISPQREGPLYRRPAGTPLPPFLHIGQAQIDCGLGELLLGRVRPTRIELEQVDVAVVCDPTRRDDRATAQRVDADARALRNWLNTAGAKLPEVAVRQADVQVFVVEHGAARLVQRLLLRAVGRSASGSYDLRVEHRPAKEAPLAELQWKRSAGEWTLGLDWLDLKTLLRLMPPDMARFGARWGLGGRVRLERLAVEWPLAGRADASARPALGPAEFQLSDLCCTLPVEADDAQHEILARPGPLAGGFLQLQNGAGTLAYRPAGPDRPAQCEATVQGQLHGAATTLRLRMRAAPLRALWAAQRTGLDQAAGPSLRLADVLQAELRVDGLDLPTADTDPTFVRSPRLPGPVAAALRDYRPRGKVNLRLRLQPPGVGNTDPALPDDAARIECELEALGAACRYRYFPYDFDDVWGTLRLAGGRVRLEALTGRHGLGRVRADGVVNNTRSWSGFDLQFRSENVTLDADLYAALPEHYRELWRQASPLGICDVVATVRRPDGSAATGPTAADVQVAAHLLGGSLALGDGRRLDHADGRITVRGGAVQVTDLHGYDGAAGVRLDGTIRSVAGKTTADLRVAVSDLPIEHTGTLGTGAPDTTAQVHFAGQADVWGRVEGSPQGGERGQWLTVHVKNGVLSGRDPALPWDVRDGWLRVQDGTREILSLACAQDDSRLEVSGKLPAQPDSATPLCLTLRARSAAIEKVYPQFAPERWRRWIDELGLAGTAEAKVDLHPAPTGPDAGRQMAQITLSASRMQPRPLPLDLRNITAELTLAPGRFRLARGTADWGPQGHIVVQQGKDGAWRADQLDADFGIAAENLVLGPELLGALPGSAPQLLEKLGLSGACDALLPSVRVTGGPARTWRIEGRLPLRDAALQLGLDVGINDGELSGVCTVGPQGDVELDGVFSIGRGQLAGRPIERWAGQVQRAADGPWVRLANIRGRLCDGAVQGDVQIDPRSSDYELSAALHDLSLDELLPRSKANPERPRRGRLDGEVWLRGTGRDVLSRRGGGDLLITGATSLQMPILASVLLLRPAPASDVLDRAHVRFRWEGGEIQLERVVIDSQDLRLVGTGTWNMRDDTVRMNLWAARPEFWPRLGLVNELLETAGQELMQYRVEGTLAAPKITARPLHRINETLRSLLGAE
jgi:hypothetical protein